MGGIIMTREEARKAAEVILAYAEGKEIQLMVRTEGQGWKDLPEGEEPKFNFSGFNYRIKPEPTYRPFKDKEECWAEMQKHQPFGWIRETLTDAYININGIDRLCVCCDEDAHEYCKAFDGFTFADGTPFGIKEE